MTGIADRVGGSRWRFTIAWIVLLECGVGCWPAAIAAAETSDAATLRIPDDEARALCESAAHAATEGTLARHEIAPDTPTEEDHFGEDVPDAVYKLVVRQGAAPIRFARFSSGVSCVSREIYNLDVMMRQLDELILVPDDYGLVDVDVADEDLRWATWGASQYLIRFDDRYLIVTGEFGVPSLLSWIRPDGRIQPLCAMGEVGTKRMAQPATPACQKIVSGLEPLDWSPIQASSPLHQERGLDQIEYARVKGRQKGKPPRIGRFSYSDGAGCGHAYTRFAVLNDRLDQRVEGAETDALGDVIEILKSNGRTYFLKSEDEVTKLEDAATGEASCGFTIHHQVDHRGLYTPKDVP